MNTGREIKEISIVIDTWDNIFSNFDLRPMSERALSEDFIDKLKKRYEEMHKKKGEFLVSICAPRFLKDEKSERTVIQRLKKHFKYRSMQRQREFNRIRTRGVIFVIFGICCLGFLTFITYFKTFTELAIKILSIIFLPLGWLGIWKGFSKIMRISSALIQEEILFNKLSNADYRFKYIGEGRDNP